MCRSISEGGARCFKHANQRLTTAEARLAAAHAAPNAATPAGYAAIAAARDAVNASQVDFASTSAGRALLLDKARAYGAGSVEAQVVTRLIGKGDVARDRAAATAATATGRPRRRTDVESAVAAITRQHPGVQLDVTRSRSGHVNLAVIKVEPAHRGQGTASAVMTELVKEADRRGWVMTLTPDGEWGSNVRRLGEFYRRFGFVPNTGRRRDMETTSTMIREPELPREDPATASTGSSRG